MNILSVPKAENKTARSSVSVIQSNTARLASSVDESRFLWFNKVIKLLQKDKNI
jgi:hypothetical protein